MFLQQVVRAQPRKRRRAGRNFIQSHAQAVDVGLRSWRTAKDDLRSDVGSRAHDVFLLAGQKLHHARGIANRETEVDDSNFTRFVHQNVVRLDVAMQPAFFMHMYVGLAHGFDHLFQARLSFWEVRRDLCFERWSAEIVHDEEAMVTRHLNLVEADEVRMLQSRPDFVLVLQNTFGF